MKKLLLTIGLLSSVSATAFAEKDSPISELASLNFTQAVHTDASLKTPIVIQDEETAKKYLEGETLKIVLRLGFSEKKVLVFFWAGSGKDKLIANVLESYPEQIKFSLKRGRTKDRRFHHKAYILRKDVSFTPPQ